MPTLAEVPLTAIAFQQSNNWTDALPVCRESGVGSSTSQMYKEDGTRQDVHSYEDCSCRIRVETDLGPTYLYGIFDGYEGVQAANFALQRIAAETLLDSQLQNKTSDEEIKEVLRQAFVAVEKGYWESLGDKIAERTSVQCEIPDHLTPYEAYQKFPHLVDKLQTLNAELNCGTTAVVALIHNGKLYVANVGDSRALLCRTDDNGVLKVLQLSVDHDLRNEDELLRLAKLGLDVEKIKQGHHLGNQDCTRCLGNYLVKGGYKEFEELSVAVSEPVIAEPDVHGSLTLDKDCQFLLLMSNSLYKSLQQVTGAVDTVNKSIAQMVVEEFRVQSTITGVAQAVVDKVIRAHHDMFMNGDSSFNRHDDITLIVRNFQFPMPNALSSPPGTQVRFNPIVSTMPVESYDEDETLTTTGTTATTTTDDSDTYPGEPEDLNARIEPYVDFSQFYKNFETARLNGTLPDTLR